MRGSSAFVVLVIGNQMIFDLMICEKAAGLACIFCSNQIYLLQGIEGPYGNVFSVTNGGSDHIQASRFYTIAQFPQLLIYKVERMPSKASTTTRIAAGFDFTATGGKRQGREVTRIVENNAVWQTQSGVCKIKCIFDDLNPRFVPV